MVFGEVGSITRGSVGGGPVASHVECTYSNQPGCGRLGGHLHQQNTTDGNLAANLVA